MAAHRATMSDLALLDSLPLLFVFFIRFYFHLLFAFTFAVFSLVSLGSGVL